MLSVSKKTVGFVCALLATLMLGGCGAKEEPTETTTPAPIVLPTAPKETAAAETDPNLDVETLTVTMAAGELYQLDYYPNLKSVDLSGSTCYDAILDFAAKRPHLTVTFTVDLGGTSVPHDAESVTLAANGYTYDALMANLQYLTKLTNLSLSVDGLTPQQVSELTTAFPELVLNYTVTLFGNAYSADTTTLDLSAMDAGGISEACAKLGLLTKLETVKLNNGLSFTDVDSLQTAAPHVVFDYSFSLFGQTISTADQEVIYKKQDIGNSGEAKLREALTIMDHCKRFVLDDCGFDYEVLAKVREDFRGGPKVIWRVRFGTNDRYSTLTDDDTIDAVYNVTDSTSGPMKYLEDVKYMDLGHNEFLTDLSFVAYMPELEVLIASESGVKELVGFENCKKLTWLELAYCYNLVNIDCLAECDGLKYLNLSYSKVTSLEPLDSLPLERFVYLKPKVSTEEQNTFTKIHPKGECITVFYGYSMPYSYGWRYDDNGKTYFWYYKDVIRKVFNYDQKQAILDAQAKK